VFINDLVSDGVVPSDSLWRSEFMLSSDGSKALANDVSKA
jgi:hypothetical protein